MFTQKLQDLMHKVNIPSFKSLSRVAGVSQWQISQLRQGNIAKIRLSVLLNISRALQISLDELLLIFSSDEHAAKSQKYLSQQIEEMKKEYQRISLTLSQQQEVLQQQFQQSSLQILESLLLQWPTVVYKVSENPELTAIKILPLVTQSLEKLLQAWEVTKIGAVGAEISYNPQLHQLVEGNAQVGELVKVRRVGYMQNGTLLHRATVIKM
ncbi:nucleotide exchange factor GrpE [Anabaena sp. FACHB-1237]|uniref:helix-turn-helix domain-containing protein n=1 Tax=Anabaena sp. FACHB-1237 TaxID=2692769 RepID=UPI0016812E0E|nr:helix-turn-helix transcriptional regulator [Anabaena sp. FACHB-1237]MBD2138917.1 nucleotide exchange factor GrpE [Anabaena sp. FACHB-1237]